jgi:hypothetical protein
VIHLDQREAFVAGAGNFRINGNATQELGAHFLGELFTAAGIT